MHVKDAIYGLKGRFCIVECQECGQLYLNPRPDENSFHLLYPKNYAMKSIRFDANPRDFASKFHNHYLEDFESRRLATFEKYINKKDRPGLLDVGCGSATFLSYLKKARPEWSLTGIEFDSDACKNIKKDSGINIINTDFENACLGENSFDIITAFHFLEHSPHPNDFLETARKLLRKDGILVLMVPNIASAEAGLFKRFWSGIDAPRHLLFFTEQSLRNLLCRHGFVVSGVSFFFNINGTLISLSTLLGTQRFILDAKKYFYINALLSIPCFILKFILLLFQKDDWITVIAKKDEK
jgi:2-polyprenyl-3-methyl-5-hydroxy-6-metoxy-1,4-benzoquinol methylase